MGGAIVPIDETRKLCPTVADKNRLEICTLAEQKKDEIYKISIDIVFAAFKSPNVYRKVWVPIIDICLSILEIWYALN